MWLILTCVLTFLFNIISFSLFPLQSKHKEDASVTRPILLDEPKFKIHLPSFLLPLIFSLHVFHLLHVFCLTHPLKSSLDLHIIFLSFSTMSLSLF